MALTSTAHSGAAYASKLINNKFSHWISKVRLSNFRNYQEADIEINKAPVILIGKNGTGKTNLLEAISLLAPGRGLRRASKDEFSYKDSIDFISSGRTWAISINLLTDDTCWQIGTGISEYGKQRVIKINGQRATQEMLSQICAVSWLTPQMDGLFLGSPNSRRRFIDRLAISFDPGHAGRLLRFYKLYRERNRMLADDVLDPVWCKVNENTLAETGVAIMATRQALISDINRAVQNMQTDFPKFQAKLIGGGTELLRKMSASDFEDLIKKQAKQNREANDYSMMGPHLTDLRLMHNEKNQLASEASTGEQKALLVTFILAHAHLQANRLKKPPILLLDDVAALLDPWRRDALFHACTALSGQVWYSGSDERSFKFFKSKAQYFFVDNGIIT